MGSMSSAVFVGSFHPNDGDLIPSHLIQIFEGSAPYFVVTSLEGPQFRQVWRLVDPELAFETLLAAVALVNPANSDHPLVNLRTIDASRVATRTIAELASACRAAAPGLVASLGAQSVLRPEQFVHETTFEIQVLTPLVERTFSAWQNEMVTLRYDQPESGAGE